MGPPTSKRTSTCWTQPPPSPAPSSSSSLLDRVSNGPVRTTTSIRTTKSVTLHVLVFLVACCSFTCIEASVFANVIVVTAGLFGGGGGKREASHTSDEFRETTITSTQSHQQHPPPPPPLIPTGQATAAPIDAEHMIMNPTPSSRVGNTSATATTTADTTNQQQQRPPPPPRPPPASSNSNNPTWFQDGAYGDPASHLPQQQQQMQLQPQPHPYSSEESHFINQQQQQQFLFFLQQDLDAALQREQMLRDELHNATARATGLQRREELHLHQLDVLTERRSRLNRRTSG